MHLFKLLFTASILSFTFYACSPEDVVKSAEATADEGINIQSEFTAVRAAVEDYVEGLYTADSTRIERSVDSTLRKVGYYYNQEDSSYIDNMPMTYDQLVHLAAVWNKDGDKVTDETPREITIYDIHDKSASAKLVAKWGIDYFHLAKINGQWKIMNVLWQSPPRD